MRGGPNGNEEGEDAGRGDAGRGDRVPPLPAGENPGDPYYGKERLDPLNPADNAVIVSKLDPSGRITEPGAQVLHWARRLAKAGLTRPARLELARSRKLFGRATRTLNNYDLPVEVSQAIGTMVREASHIGVIRGQHWQVLRGREGMPKARIAPAQKGKVNKKEARRRLEREIIDEYHRSLDGENGPLVRWLGGKLLERTGKATPPSTLRGDIKAMRDAATSICLARYSAITS